jgi:hypothetical protein
MIKTRKDESKEGVYRKEMFLEDKKVKKITGSSTGREF